MLSYYKLNSRTPDNQHVEIGNPKVVINDFIKKNNIDFLIVGHHERKGIYHLLGSTTQALLSHAKCEVLVIPYPGFSILVSVKRSEKYFQTSSTITL